MTNNNSNFKQVEQLCNPRTVSLQFQFNNPVSIDNPPLLLQIPSEIITQTEHILAISTASSTNNIRRNHKSLTAPEDEETEPFVINPLNSLPSSNLIILNPSITWHFAQSEQQC